MRDTSEIQRGSKSFERKLNKAAAEGVQIAIDKENNMHNEERIKRHIESCTNRYDAALMAGRLDQKAYDYQMSELNKWADMQYRIIAAMKLGKV